MVKKPKVKKVVPYNKQERLVKVLNLISEISELKMSFVLTPEIRKRFDEYAETGREYNDTIDIPKISRQMIISLINDKHQKTFVNFKYVDLNGHDVRDVTEKCNDEKCNDEKCNKL